MLPIIVALSRMLLGNILDSYGLILETNPFIFLAWVDNDIITFLSI